MMRFALLAHHTPNFSRKGEIELGMRIFNTPVPVVTLRVNISREIKINRIYKKYHLKIKKSVMQVSDNLITEPHSFP